MAQERPEDEKPTPAEESSPADEAASPVDDAAPPVDSGWAAPDAPDRPPVDPYLDDAYLDEPGLGRPGMGRPGIDTPGLDETRIVTPEETMIVGSGLPSVPEIEVPPMVDATSIMPSTPPGGGNWSGRAEVRQPQMREPWPAGEGETELLRQPKTWWTPLLLGLLALVLVGAVIIGAAFLLRDGKPQPQPTPALTTGAATTAASPTPSPTPTVEPSASAQMVTIPAGLVGQSQQTVTKQLDSLNLAYSLDFLETDDVAPGTVVALDPAEGSVVPVGSAVKLTIAYAKQKPTPTPTPTGTPT